MGCPLPSACRDELGDGGQLGPDVGGEVDVGQARVRRGNLYASAQSLPPVATTRPADRTGAERSLPKRGARRGKYSVTQSIAAARSPRTTPWPQRWETSATVVIPEAVALDPVGLAMESAIARLTADVRAVAA
jgi:hypothetical protein